MVALLHPDPQPADRPGHGRSRGGLRLVVDNTGSSAARPRPLGLPALGDDRLVVAVVAAVAMVVFGGLLSVRLIQGGPGDPGSVARSGVPAAAEVGAGDQLVVARPGDSLWSIARSIDPDGDPRPVVAALIDANGGASLQAGQQIVIPQELLD